MLETDLNKFSEAVDALDIKPDDCLLIHSALYRFGKLKFSLDSLFDYLVQIVPDGQLILPTFTYSYRRGQVYDPKTSRPDKKMGVLVDHSFEKFIYRNDCPLFSFGAVGQGSEHFIKRKSPNCFGAGSVFDQLCDMKVKILCLGVDFNSGISMFMNCEKLANVPYRKDLLLSGQSLRNGYLIEDKAIHFARDELEHTELNVDRREIGLQLIEKEICKTSDVSRVPIYLIDSDQFRDHVTSELIKNPLCMVIQ